jgi:CubicO group peptidase (beta-lactamase class C family)
MFQLRKVAAILLVLPLGAFALLTPAATNDPAAMDAIVRKARDFWKVPGTAIAIVRDDQVIYLKGFGVTEVGKPEPVTPDTLFPLASCTKAFTTTAMAMLADEGKLDWDDHVRKHLDYFHLADPLADEDVRLRDLVCHRTGLAPNDLLWYRSPWAPEEVVQRIGHVKLKHPFRTAFQYQTTMFTAAGLAAAHAAGCPWDRLVQRRIFDPLGMKSANFTTSAALASSDHASPHRRNAQGKIEVIPWYPMTVPDPAGSINASVRDLAQWMRFQLGDGTFEGKRLVSAKNLGETHMAQMVIRMEGLAKAMNPETVHMSYGMAWVIQDYRGRAMRSHAGVIDGFRAHITLLPADRIGIVILNNLDRTTMNLAASNALVDLLLKLPSRDWNAYFQQKNAEERTVADARFQERQKGRRPDSRPSHGITAYVGDYEDAAYGTATISIENERLLWKWYSFTAPLMPFNGDTFTIDNDLLGHPRVQFTLADGHIAGMKLMDVAEVEFVKVKVNSGGR